MDSWNAGAEQLQGYTSKAILGAHLSRFYSPEDVAHGKPEQILQEALASGRAEARGMRVRKDGTQFWAEVMMVPIYDQRGELHGFCQIVHETTDHKAASEALREQARILDLAQVMVRDLRGQIVMWNSGAEKLYGFSRDEAVTRISHDLLQTQFPLPLPQIEAILHETGSREGELIHRRKDGGTVIVASTWTLYRDEQGKPIRVLESNTDVTARKLAEEKLAQSEQQIRLLNEGLEQRVGQRTAELAAANKELEAFTYSVSHDLRAPLRHIAGFSGILREEFGSGLAPQAQHYLERIQDGTRKMGLLVDELLNLARVGWQSPSLQVTGLNSLVEEVLSLLKSQEKEREVEWKIANLPFVECDPTLMKQVFQNLVSNALKYSRPREHAVIEIGQTKADGQNAVYVRDNGVGFSMKYADKLFGVFQRLHRAEDFEGTGVGLATVQRIIQKHGGRVWAESELDRGANVLLHPRERASDRTGSRDKDGSKCMTMTSGDILLVDDSPDDLDLTLHVLRRENLANRIAIVRDGEEALDYIFCREQYAERRPDEMPRLILLDLKLPKIDGIEVLRQIKSDPRTRIIPVVILTSSREEQDLVNGYNLGANSYIQKPVDFEQFRQVVKVMGLYWLVTNQRAVNAAAQTARQG